MGDFFKTFFSVSSDARAPRAQVHEQITLSEYFPFGATVTYSVLQHAVTAACRQQEFFVLPFLAFSS